MVCELYLNGKREREEEFLKQAGTVSIKKPEMGWRETQWSRIDRTWRGNTGKVQSEIEAGPAVSNLYDWIDGEENSGKSKCIETYNELCEMFWMCDQGKQLTVKAQISGETLGLGKEVSTDGMLMEEVSQAAGGRHLAPHPLWEVMSHWLLVLQADVQVWCWWWWFLNKAESLHYFSGRGKTGSKTGCPSRSKRYPHERIGTATKRGNLGG